MTIDAAAALAIALAAPFAARRWNGSWVAPAAIVLVAWGTTYGLYSLHLLPFIHHHPGTRGLVAATVAVLVLGTQAGMLLVRHTVPAAAEPSDAPLSPWWIAGFSLAGLAGTAWYVLAVGTTLGWRAFADGERLREALSAGVVSSRFLVLQLSAIVAPLLALAVRQQGGRLGPVVTALVAGAAASTIFSTDRTQIFLLVLTASYAVALHAGRALRPRRLAAGAALAAAALVAAFLVIGVWTKKAPGDLQMELRWPAPDGEPARPLPQAAQPFAVLYAYATCSYPALDYLLGRPRPYTGGAHSAYPILRALQRAGLYDRPLPAAIAPFVTLIEEPGRPPVLFNTYTFLYYPLEDFGRSGALVYAFAIGVLAGAAFGAAVRRPRAPLRLVAAHVATALTLTPFVNKFNNTAWWYLVAATALPWIATAAWRRFRPRAAPPAQPDRPPPR